MKNIHDKKIFEEFIGKPIKLVIQDIDKPHFIRGTLIKVSKDFIYINGDYSDQVIAVKSILKITFDKGRGAENG